MQLQALDWGIMAVIAAIGVLITVIITAAVTLTLLTPREDEAVPKGFRERVRPPGPGWARFRANKAAGEVSRGQIGTAFFCTIAGCIMVYSRLFSIGAWPVATTPAVEAAQ